MGKEVQFTITIVWCSHNEEMCSIHKHTITTVTFCVIFINIHMNLRTDTGHMEQLQARSRLRFSPMVVYTFFLLTSLVHRTYVSLISLVSFWIFVLVDMSTYLSPILTIMPPRIEESVCRETLARIRDSFKKKIQRFFFRKKVSISNSIERVFIAPATCINIVP